MTLTHDELLDLTQAMETFGGSFAKAIARAWHVADRQNRAILEHTFSDLFVSYRHFIRQEG